MPEPTPRTSQPSTATPKQLRYLKALAAERGQSFTYPRTAREASREIKRLQKSPRSMRSDVIRERRQIADDMVTRRGDAASVRRDEITGYGSSARWAGRDDAD